MRGLQSSEAARPKSRRFADRLRPKSIGGARPYQGAMGIKFHCPNGHKLNVKSFLAGKKGVCPKCGTRVRIPAVSEGDAADSDIGAAAVGATAAANGANDAGHA